MLLFKKPFWDGLTRGTITLTFRRWQKAHVRAGGRYRCHPIGVLLVSSVETVSVASISEADASATGFPSREALLAYLAELGPIDGQTQVWRVALAHVGDGDRLDLALEDRLSPSDVEAIKEKLARLDARGAWTGETLAIIEASPRVAASALAAKLGRETAPFKVDVRKLKHLGLTQSFEVGYEIAPRGRAFLDASRARPTAKPRRRR